MSDVVLPWFPYDTEAWERRVRVLGLTFEGEGILHRLARRTWLEERPCTIRNNPEDFARILGPQWRRALVTLREHFTPLPDEPKVLRCEWLYEDYLRALKKHESYQTRGAKGGRPKKNDREQLEADLKPGRKAQQKAQGKAELLQSSSEGNSSPLSEERAITPASDSALAPRGAAPRAAVATNGTAKTPRAEQADQLEEHALAYGDELNAAANEWMEDSPDIAKEIGREQRAALGLPTGVLPNSKITVLREAVVEAIRKRENWPTADAWDGRSPLYQPSHAT